MNKGKNEEALRFIKELTWLFNDYSHVDLTNFFNKMNSNNEMKNHIEFNEYIPKNRNAFFLVGVLPKLLMNEKIFPLREDLYDFGKEYLDLEVNRYNRMNRKEIVGFIVCELSEIENDMKLEKISRALKKLMQKIDDNHESDNSFSSWRDILDEVYK